MAFCLFPNLLVEKIMPTCEWVFVCFPIYWEDSAHLRMGFCLFPNFSGKWVLTTVLNTSSLMGLWSKKARALSILETQVFISYWTSDRRTSLSLSLCIYIQYWNLIWQSTAIKVIVVLGKLRSSTVNWIQWRGNGRSYSQGWQTA